MSTRTLGEIKASVEQLDLPDQVRLLEYLTPKIASAVLATSAPQNTSADAREAWRRYRAVGQRLAITSTPGSQSLTHAVNEMRR